MASPDSKFDDLSDEKIDLVIDDAIPKNTEKATASGKPRAVSKFLVRC